MVPIGVAAGMPEGFSAGGAVAGLPERFSI
jgi:hypothetical protein